ncbi:hypothetical protein BS78_02G033600 [Paspalum vaginatum]|nr:hypothetical protein BS78_02G033600 [Paspalum vaginatum]
MALSLNCCLRVSFGVVEYTGGCASPQRQKKRAIAGDLGLRLLLWIWPFTQCQFSPYCWQDRSMLCCFASHFICGMMSSAMKIHQTQLLWIAILSVNSQQVVLLSYVLTKALQASIAMTTEHAKTPTG